jgi:DNA-directed RNA polymerase subunit RPC12/RpoP
MIRLSCPMCGKKLAVDESRAGTVGACPECRHKIRIPGTPPARATAPASARESKAAKKTAPKEERQPPTPVQAPVKSPEESWRKADSTPYAFKEDTKPPPPPEFGKRRGVDYEMEFARRPRLIEVGPTDPELMPGLSYFKALLILGLLGWVLGLLYTYMMPGYYIVIGSLLFNLAVCVAGFTWCLFLVMKRQSAGSGKPLVIGILGFSSLATVFVLAYFTNAMGS